MTNLTPARLYTVKTLRELSYTAIESPGIGIPQVYAAADAILDTPVDKLCDMIVMSDTVLGNWRTIAATLVPA